MTAHDSADGSAAATDPARRYASRMKARKPWTCSGCGRRIAPGEAYEYSYEHGGTNEQRRCKECAGYD